MHGIPVAFNSDCKKPIVSRGQTLSGFAIVQHSWKGTGSFLKCSSVMSVGIQDWVLNHNPL